MNNQQQQTSILVTGATGMSGSIVIKEFARQQVPVRALVRNRAKAKALEQYPNVEIVEGDMLQPETLQPALAGIKKALLISAAAERMVDTQQSFIDAAREAGVPHIIKYSGADSGIGFNSQNFIGQRHHEHIEDYLVNSGLTWTLLRPSQFMQYYLPGTATGVNLQRHALVLPVGHAKLAPVAIEDVAKVCFALLTQDGHEGKIYEMTGPDAMNMYEACEIISNATGQPFDYIHISMEDYEKALVAAAVSPERVRILLEISKERRKCTDSNIRLDTHKRFGIRPTNFAEFIYKNAAAFKH